MAGSPIPLMAGPPIPLIAAGLSAMANGQLQLFLPSLQPKDVYQLSLTWVDVPTGSANDVPEGEFLLFVKTMTGKTIEIKAHPFLTIIQVKQKIELQEKIPKDEQMLLFCGKLLKDDKTLSNYNCAQEATLHLVLRVQGSDYSIHKLYSDFLDPEYDYDFTAVPPDQKDASFYRGGVTYIRPYGWKRYAVKVLGRYTDDRWLGLKSGYRTESNDGEWAVSYHGSDREKLRDIAMEGFDLSKGKRFLYGRGIYSTPYPEIAADYSSEFLFEEKKYKMIVQNRVDLMATEVVNDGKYYVTIAEENIRPYGLLISEVSKKSEDCHIL